MVRHLLALPLILAMALFVAVRADDPESPKKSREADDAAVKQESLARQFNDFKNSLLRLAVRLERSSRAEDRERAVVMRKAIDKANEETVDHKFEVLVNTLKNSKGLNLNEVKEAMDQSDMLAKDIQAILAILLSDDRDAQRRIEIERLRNLIKFLDQIIREQKITRSQLESQRMDKNSLGKAQKKVTGNTEKLARAMSKPSEPKDGKGKDGKGGKGGQGGDKGGEPKDSKPGAKKDDKLPPPQETEGRKQVQDAIENQKKAEQHIEKEKNNDASDEQSKAIEKLEEARKKLEELLRQLREEELRRLLAKLEERCQRMLAIQLDVYDKTVNLDKEIAQNGEKKATREEEQRSLRLSDKEAEITREADYCLKLLENEGSAIAFVEVFTQVREDSRNVARRLSKADVGSVTQIVEQDIIALLKEMIEALKKASKGGGGGGGGGNPQNGSLIDLLAELKMIRSMQIRVNTRTLTYARQYQGEQANDPDIRKELEGLADRQARIFDATNNLARGKAEQRPGQ